MAEELSQAGGHRRSVEVELRQLERLAKIAEQAGHVRNAHDYLSTYRDLKPLADGLRLLELKALAEAETVSQQAN